MSKISIKQIRENVVFFEKYDLESILRALEEDKVEFAKQQINTLRFKMMSLTNCIYHCHESEIKG